MFAQPAIRRDLDGGLDLAVVDDLAVGDREDGRVDEELLGVGQPAAVAEHDSLGAALKPPRRDAAQAWRSRAQLATKRHKKTQKGQNQECQLRKLASSVHQLISAKEEVETQRAGWASASRSPGRIIGVPPTLGLSFL